MHVVEDYYDMHKVVVIQKNLKIYLKIAYFRGCIIAGLLPVADGNGRPIADGNSKRRQNDQYNSTGTQ